MLRLFPDTIPIEPVHHPLLNEKQVRMDVLRLDLIHPLISGNKWYKLRYYVAPHRHGDPVHLITYGGAWSNHILATAALGQEMNWSTTGLIRGEAPTSFSETLEQARSLGMQLRFLSRTDYRDKMMPDDLQADIQQQKALLIPEGGYGIPGKDGAATIPGLLPSPPYDEIFAACGTGTTLAGLIEAVGDRSRVTGISVLKGHTGLERDILALLPDRSALYPHQLSHDDHEGGYARYTPELIAFMNEFYEHTGIPTDFVYTGKLFQAVMRRVKENHFAPQRKILVIHSGGLQGNRSLKKGTLIF